MPLSRREAIWGYCFILPWLIGLVWFSLWPIAGAIYYSLTEYSVLEAPRWVGLENYRKIFTEDPLFWTALANTVIYVAMLVPTQIVLGFALALLLNQKVRGIAYYRAAVYVPTVVPSVANAVIWVWIFNPELSVFKLMLDPVGVPSPLWLQSELWSKPALAIVALWATIGTTMMIFLAGLQGIPEQLYEAADIDGASRLAKLRNVTLPLMTPTIFFNVVIGIINSFQVFVYAFIMTKGGPLNSSLVYVLYIYRRAFEFFEMGYASALAFILFVLVLLLTVVVFWSSRRWVYYDYN
ncbi:MAG: sugar ABC transporter permease [Chloroflexi bacterium]|nr:sugar ABC transporter permease [Chloroflexota bacterium]